jgi:hypothetical protein
MSELYSVPNSLADAKYRDKICPVTKGQTMSGELKGEDSLKDDIILEKETMSPHEDQSLRLPTPVTASFPATPPKQRSRISTSSHKINRAKIISIRGMKIRLDSALYISIWIILSWSTIIYNDYIWYTLEFKYPMFLFAWQITLTSIGTHVLARTTRLLDGAKTTKLTEDIFGMWIFPITLLFSVSSHYSSLNYTIFSARYIQTLEVR